VFKTDPNLTNIHLKAGDRDCRDTLIIQSVKIHGTQYPCLCYAPWNYF